MSETLDFSLKTKSQDVHGGWIDFLPNGLFLARAADFLL